MLATFPGSAGITSLSMSLSIPSEKTAEWKRRSQPSTYGKGQVLFYRGHYAYGLYVIFSGRVDLCVSEKGGHVPIQARSNSLLGLPSLVSEQPYPLMAVVGKDASVSFVEKCLLLDWIHAKDPLLPEEAYLIDIKNMAKRS